MTNLVFAFSAQQIIEQNQFAAKCLADLTANIVIRWAQTQLW